MIPRILRDRDAYRKWYLEEDYTHTLHNGDVYPIKAGYRFDGHSLDAVIGVFSLVAAFFASHLLWFLACMFWVGVIIAYLLKIQDGIPPDILAAMVHDHMIDHESTHRYNRDFMDTEYWVVMSKVSYGWRRFLMPRAVYVLGYLRFTLWGDDRGTLK